MKRLGLARRGVGNGRGSDAGNGVAIGMPRAPAGRRAGLRRLPGSVRAGVIGLLVLGVAGCASLPPDPAAARLAEAAWVRHEARLRDLDRWEMSGRIAVSSAEEAWNAELYWSQAPEGYTIAVVAPLGGGAFRLHGDADNVRLETPDEALYEADSPEALMGEVLGLEMPVAGLRYWVLGVPRPGVPQQYELDGSGRLRKLEQESWRVEYLRYRDLGGWSLPEKLYMRNARFELRLVISDWRLPAGSARRSGGTAGNG